VIGKLSSFWAILAKFLPNKNDISGENSENWDPVDGCFYKNPFYLGKPGGVGMP
jgi:hypothetical protein